MFYCMLCVFFTEIIFIPVFTSDYERVTDVSVDSVCFSHAGGPCYRCLFPRPPPPETVTNCSDGGVLGVVPGIIGSLQALEAVRLIVPGLSSAHSQRLLLFDGLLGGFRTVKLRGRQPDCALCGETPTVTQLVDYVQFCGAAPTDKVGGFTELQRVLAGRRAVLPAMAKCWVVTDRPYKNVSSLRICCPERSGLCDCAEDGLFYSGGASFLMIVKFPFLERNSHKPFIDVIDHYVTPHRHTAHSLQATRCGLSL